MLEAIHQPESPAVSAPVLYYTSGNVSRHYGVEPFSFLPSWCSVYHRSDYRSLRCLQKFCNSDSMLARWYMLLGQFSVTFEYCPWSQHASVSYQCGQCLRADCAVGPPDFAIVETSSTSDLAEQPVNQPWVIQWIQTCSRSCPVRRGWMRSTWIRPTVTCLRLNLILI